MINIDFKTDLDIMARVLISKSMMPRDYANYLWNKYQTSYSRLIWDLISKEIDPDIIAELKEQDFFKSLSVEAEKNLERIQKSWIENRDKINEFLKGIFKKDFTLNMTAIIVAPSMNTGVNIHDDQFVWGHENGVKDEIYDLVYLVHESLHSYFENGELTHSIIENIADVELAKFLSDSDRAYECSDYLKMTHIKVAPFWYLYLDKPIAEIKKENKNIGITYQIDAFEKYRSKIEGMNLDEFVAFLDRLNLDDTLEVSYLVTLKE